MATRQSFDGASGAKKATAPSLPSLVSKGVGPVAPTVNPGAYKPMSPVKPAAPAPAAPAPRSQTFAAPGGGASYGGGALGATPQGFIAETASPGLGGPQTFDAWKAAGGQIGDAAFGAEDASAEADYRSLLAQLAQQNTNYMTDWGQGLRGLGWKYQDDNFGAGNWDMTDTLGAYGSAYQNTQNDFSGRGLMDSTFYQQAQDNLLNRFNQQKADLITNRTNTQNEYGQAQASAASARQNAQNRALAEAYARYAAGYGV